MWYKNGQKLAERTFKDGKTVTVVAWKPNGEKCPVTNVVDGDGVVVWYNEDGTVLSRETYKDGERVYGSFEPGKINTARNWVNGLGKAAVTTYYIQAGKYPMSLDDLLVAPQGATAAVVDKASGLLDPWKKKYQYNAPPGDKNPGRFDIWTTAPDGTMLGNWDTAVGH